MRPNKDEYLMGLAMLAASRTTCIRRGVGCVLANERGHILSIGYNGVAGGMPHCNQVTGFKFIYAKGIDKKKQLTGQSTGEESVYGNVCAGHDLPPGQDNCEAVHAEQNALLQCDDVWDIHTAYVTLSPCKACMKLLLNTGCKRLVFKEQHADLMPLDLWQKAGREFQQMDVITNPLIAFLDVLSQGTKPAS